MSRYMMVLCSFTLIHSFSLGIPAQQPDPADPPQPRVKITISRETTFFTEPVDAKGRVDLAAALNRHYAEGVTVENNAVVPLYQVLGPSPEGGAMPDEFFQLVGMVRPGNGRYLTSLSETLQGLPQSAIRDVYDQLDQAMKRPWTSDEFPLIETWLNQNEEFFELISEAARRPRYYSPLVVSKSDDGREIDGLIAALLPGVQKTREIGRLLTCRAMKHLGQGRTDEAWQDLHDCQRLGRLAGQGPTLVEGLVGVAIDSIASTGKVAVLEHSRLTPKEVQKYLADLDALPPIPDMAERIDIGERTMYLDTVQMIADGSDMQNTLNLFGSDLGGLSPVLDRLTASAIDWDVVMRMGNQWYDRLAEAMREEDYQRRQEALAEIDAELQSSMEVFESPLRWAARTLLNPRKGVSDAMGRVLISLILPAVTASQSAEDRSQQVERNLRVALALAAFHNQHGFTFPDSLDQLSPGFLPNVPTDLFTGQPLVYRKVDQGYVLYSRGPNGHDDGGRGHDDEMPGDDLVIRIKD